MQEYKKIMVSQESCLYVSVFLIFMSQLFLGLMRQIFLCYKTVLEFLLMLASSENKSENFSYIMTKF